MAQPSVNRQPARKPNVAAFNRPRQLGAAGQFLTEEQVREVVMEMLIALDLIPKAQKKQVMKIA
jgi:hypothetical protein